MEKEKKLFNLISQIKPTEKSFVEKMQTSWDLRAHPPGSLGQLEKITAKFAAIQKTLTPKLSKSCTCVFAADNGVCAEGITSQPQRTTFFLAESMVEGNTGLGAISKYAVADIFIYDVGLIETSQKKGINNLKLQMGTKNIAREPAMSRDECVEMIMRGIDVAKKIFSEDGYQLAGVGELGIGNTTTSAAVLSALSGSTAEDTAGRGASSTPEMYARKIRAVKKALQINLPDADDPIDCISKVGGFDIAAMCGFFLGAGIYSGAAVIDGYISSVAALAALRLCPSLKDYLFASHLSHEKGAKIVAELLGLRPVFDLEMRLGEGSGCPLFYKLMECSLFIFYNMGKFTDTPISQDELVDLRKK